MHSFHLVEVGPAIAARAMVRPPTGAKAPGLVHAECLAGMRLGAPVVSPDRLQLTRLVVFAEWADEGALDRFLDAHPVGRQLADGWHVRLDLVRRWGSVDPFAHLPETAGRLDPGRPGRCPRWSTAGGRTKAPTGT